LKIRNIVFDLGGVLLNINYQLTEQAFVQLGIRNFAELYSQAEQSDLFNKLETGKIEPADFRSEIRSLSGLKLSDKQIDKAWNAMLLDMPKHRITMLKELKQSGYKLFLLSNTNEIHYNAYTKSLKEKYDIDGLEEFFNHSFFSHQIGMRKPDTETFKYVLEEAKINAAETIFIDDSIQHIKGARRANIKSYLMKDEIGWFLMKILPRK